ncbi:YbdK family carboxylate-amine ligase [Mumia sp. zg.B17]|uniref:carboxylate-amine ligase n=1 Tax=Mumia sp. zg.B17 TaxID=2855446 RepID=UPI001C6F10AE|nr:YbdK family carboxylate-amine ligase [Mumia sp. zg.B17]MBW9207139.1 YbdK family carboxylate-amine ligase [Mumia sp. zg.B17]
MARRSPEISDLDWHPGGDFTLGGEDELFLVDQRGLMLGPAAESVMSTLSARGPHGTLKGEIFVDEIELETPICSDAEGVHRSLQRLRSSLVAEGVRPMAVGLHPSAGFGAADLAASPRYDRIGGEFAGLLRTPTAAFQVHVGVPDPATALKVYRGLRNRLSVFRALAAGSPYWHARDSGLACVRPAILRSYPRTTMPPALPTWEEYVEAIELAVWAHEVPDYSYVCWELRPQPRLGTIEVRVMDAQSSLARAAGLTALVQGLARHAVESPDLQDLPDEVVIANDLRACRYGLEASVVDADGSRRPMREIAARALDDARKQLTPDGSGGLLDAVQAILVEPPEYVRQRALYERDGMPALLADLAARTADLDG